jgi:glycosyltransferase involved in cell wall biosynthesis
LRIIYDGYIYSIQQKGGINRYFANIISRLPEDWQPIITTVPNRDLESFEHRNLDVLRYDPLPLRPTRIFYGLNKYYHRAVTASRRPDLAHPTYYNLLTEQKLESYSYPFVITVWDMLHEKFLYKVESQRHIPEVKRKAILAASAILCISENTKKDLLEYYPDLAEEKITVTYLASDIRPDLSKGTEPVPEYPYFLYVGTRSNYKNFDGLLTAFQRLSERHPEFRLCVVGPSFTEEEERQFTDTNIKGKIIHYGHVDDGQLVRLYQRCAAFVYPSLYEGFGIPPLEAMECGAIVIAANRSSLPEVVEDAGLLFDPDDSHSLTECLFSIVEERIDRADLIRRGHIQSQKFSWDRTAEQTVRVYNSTLQQLSASK